MLFIDADPEQKDAHKWGVCGRPYILDVASKKREPLADFPENGRAMGVAWSPDGKRGAASWQELNGELLKKDTIAANEAAIETEGFLVMSDADGKNAKTIATDKRPFAFNLVFGSLDWR